MAEAISVTGEHQADDAGTATSSLVSDTGEQTPVRRPGTFSPGHDPRRNTAGRIKKKPTVLDETIRVAESSKRRKRIANAWANTMEREDAAGNRARADYSDRVYGLPKQTLVLEAGESRADSLDARLEAYLAARTVDGEAKLLDVTEREA